MKKNIDFRHLDQFMDQNYVDYKIVKVPLKGDLSVLGEDKELICRAHT